MPRVARRRILEVPEVTAQTGETLLFCISPGIWRPLIVTRGGPRATGMLFLDPDEDSSAEWVVQNCFHRPTKEKPWVLVAGALSGGAPGCWRKR